MAQMAQGAEPPMFLQRPSSARSQDVTHVLARTFRELFTRDSVGQDTVQYLNQSRGGDDSYHEKYVEALQKVQEERERRLSEVAMLERHIMQAQARAMSADERQLNRAASGSSRFPDLGLPPARSHFRSCIDTELLRSHSLVTPEDFTTEEPPTVPPPKRTMSEDDSLSTSSRHSAPAVPSYAQETATSLKRTMPNMATSSETPLSARDSVHSSLTSISCENDEPEQGLQQPHLAKNPQQVSATWQDQVTPEGREVGRVRLANLEAKVNYLKNPRHVPPSEGAGMLTRPKKQIRKEIGIKPKSEKVARPEPTTVFVPSPPVICFTEYNVGHVFEMTLELKNVTTAMRPVRIVPPRTGYFSVGLGQFPGEHGLVAPGMSCHYTIRFSPDSLSDYDDYVTVQTQSSSPLVIHLQGRRVPPVLTLPEHIDVGQCLIGGHKVARLAVVNEGGPGRFCMMRRHAWPASNFKLTVASGSVELPPFVVRPAVFELGHRGQMVIDVHFSPTANETYTEDLTMVCDNCHVKHFTLKGEGQRAGLELLSMEGGLCTPAPGELCDVTAQHLIRFDPLNPYTYYQRALRVRNLANVEVPFSWVVVKPLLEPPDPEREESARRRGPQERVQDVDSAFSVEPQCGLLPPNGVGQFILTFAPPLVGEYHSVLHLILREVPHQQSLPWERPASTTSDGLAEIVLPLGGAGDVVQDLTALECGVKATCVPFSVLLQPYAIYIPGQVLVETSVKRQFRMVNASVSSVLFQWEKVHQPSYIMEVEPPIGELGPQEELEFELSVSGSKPGKLTHTLQCLIQHLEEPLMLAVHAEIKGPEVVIEQSNLNFGLVRFGDTVQQTVLVRNMCQVAARWTVQESQGKPSESKSDEIESEFVFSPESGELRPLEAVEVTVIFRPQAPRSIRTAFEVNVEDGNQSTVAVRGEVQQPQACLLNCKLIMPEVFLDVPTCHQVTLLNQTLLTTYFEWGEVQGEGAEACSVMVEPRVGNLAPREKVTININFTAHQTGDVGGLLLPCTVAGMDTPLYLALSCTVLGLSVTYRTSNSMESTSSSDLVLDFGHVQLNEAPRCILYIKNNSAITAPFSLSVEHFYVKPPTPPGGRPDNQIPNKSTQRRAMLGRTPNLADPTARTSSKAQMEMSRTMLRRGKGAAFLVQPSSGMLQPFSEQLVEVTGFSDTWGEYKDILNCQVERQDVKIPMKMISSGCPLQFQMVAAQPTQKPILRFGTHVSGVQPVVRQMRINNLSPFDIRLDWRVFNNDSESKQLVDLITTFGQAFPLLDENGEEIVPPDTGKSQVVERLPTEYISNSPDTTSTLSREVTTHTPCDASEGISSEQPQAVRPQRLKVISVTLREHSGINVNKPYDIFPQQQVIPAKGNSNISVPFTPQAEGEVTKGTDCLGYALGYMSLSDERASVEGQVTRLQGYDVAPLKLNMTAHVKPALLTIECTEDDGMLYLGAASDLLHNGQVMAEHLRLCSTRLSNHTETPLVFKLMSADPFKLVQLDPKSQTPTAQLLETDNFTLLPQRNIMVHVGFRVSLGLLEHLKRLTSQESGECEGVELETIGQERRLHFKQNLTVQFNNRTSQRIPLFATLTVPALVLSKTTLDFGTCLVGQLRELQLELSNPTASISSWSTVTEWKSETCTPDTFTLTPSSGMLEAYVTYTSKSKVLLKVFFVAKHSEDYEAVFLFRGMLGEEPSRLQVKGQGSYDGKHEAIVNI